MKISDLKKYYGDKKIYDGFNLEIKDGEVVALLGRSGSGKTTLLNVLAGLTDYEGNVEGVDGVSFVFQSDRLVPNLTVEENIKLVSPDADIPYLLAMSGLENAGGLYPKELSGGMARRVALLRAFSFKSNLILLDEPFRNLDLALKLSMGKTFKDLWEKDGRTCILVTHDVEEALSLAKRVIIIEQGEIVYDKYVSDKQKTYGEIKEVMLAETIAKD